MYSNIFDRLAFISLLLVIVFLPLFFLPFTTIPVETSKGLFLVVGLTLAVTFWAIGRFVKGEFVMPRSAVLLSGLAVAVVFLLSAIFSGSSNVSLFGVMFDLGSFWFIFAGLTLLFISAIIFRTEAQAQLLLWGMVFSATLLMIFQALRFLIPAELTLGVLGGKTDNLIGVWNSLGIFAGFSALMFILLIEFFPVSRLSKILLQIMLLLAVLISATVNFALVWVLLGISSLIIFVYKASSSLHAAEGEERRFPVMSFAIVILSVLLLTSGQMAGNLLPGVLGITNTEIGPSIDSTLAVTKGVVKDKPILGIGPNRFGEAWVKYKPAAINNTQFADVVFEVGYGAFPTMASTTGVLGILAVILFSLSLVWSGARSVFAGVHSNISWTTMAAFVLSLYLLVSLWFYSAGIVIYLLFMALAGVLVGLKSTKENNDWHVVFISDHRKSFISILALILLVVCSAVLAFQYVERFASVRYLRKALAAENVNDAELNINKALNLNYNDLYLRAHSQVYLAKLNILAGEGNVTEEKKPELQAAFDQALRSAELAVAYNPKNFINYRFLGTLYESAGTAGIKEANPKALAAYKAADALNSSSPMLKIDMSRASLAAGDSKDALKYAEEALALAPSNPAVVEYVNTLKSRISAPVTQ
jgi:hypothetical protein